MEKNPNVEKICQIMVWRKSKIRRDEEYNREKVIKIDSGKDKDPNIAIVLDKADDPLPGNPIVVFGHGNGQNISNFNSAINFSDSFCPRGISTCYIDYRGYGFSDGEYGSGVTEPDDVITVINYLKKNGYEKISYFGYSLGATCGIYVASHFPDLVCVTLDSPWLSFKEWTAFKVKRKHRIGNDEFEKAIPLAYSKINEKYGFDFNQIVEPRELAAKINQPLFLIHGKLDVLVPPCNSDELIKLVQSQEKTYKSGRFDHCSSLRIEFWEEAIDFILKHNGVDLNDDEKNLDE